MNSNLLLLLAITILTSATSSQAADPPGLIPPFADQENHTLNPQWQALKFSGIDRLTHYEIQKDAHRIVVLATSNNSASGLILKQNINPEDSPIITWSWKINKPIASGNVLEKKGDDACARVYIAMAYNPDNVSFFEMIKYEAIKLFYGEYPPSGAITYIWANKVPVGQIVNNPYTDRVKIIVVESGANKAGNWQFESRNIVADYHQAFGKKPGKISGIAIMTDTDNTSGQCQASYGNIQLHKIRNN